jgi:hypothetical protein
VGALNPEGAAEADEIACRADMLVGHSRSRTRWERFVNMPRAQNVRGTFKHEARQRSWTLT